MTDTDFERPTREEFVNALAQLGARVYCGERGSNTPTDAFTFGKRKSGKIFAKRIKIRENDRQRL